MRPRVRDWLLIAGLVCGGLAATGCGRPRRPQPERATVSGTVRLDGKPIPMGEIIFLALSGDAVDKLPIADGAFSGSVTVGPQRVQFASFTTVKRSIFPDKPPENVRENSLPARLGADSSHTATIQAGTNPPLNFDLQSPSGSSRKGP